MKKKKKKFFPTILQRRKTISYIFFVFFITHFPNVVISLTFILNTMFGRLDGEKNRE